MCVQYEHRRKISSSNAHTTCAILVYLLASLVLFPIHSEQHTNTHSQCMRSLFVPAAAAADESIVLFSWKHTHSHTQTPSNRYHSNCQLIFTDEPMHSYPHSEELSFDCVVHRISITQCTGTERNTQTYTSNFYSSCLCVFSYRSSFFFVIPA